MSISRKRALARNAWSLGISLAEYMAHVDAGHWRCRGLPPGYRCPTPAHWVETGEKRPTSERGPKCLACKAKVGAKTAQCGAA